MQYKRLADFFGLIASWIQLPFLIAHGIISLVILLRGRNRFLDLRNITYEEPEGISAVLVCLMPAFYYYIDALHLGAYFRTSITSRAYFIHHVFGINMMFFGIQTKFGNYTSLMMQAGHGLLIASFLMSKYVSVVACNFYFYIGVAMIAHHLAGVWLLQGAWRKIACIGFAWSVGVMAMLRNQEEIFSSCVNPESTPTWIIALEVISGASLAVVSVLPPLRRTFFR